MKLSPFRAAASFNALATLAALASLAALALLASLAALAAAEAVASTAALVDVIVFAATSTASAILPSAERKRFSSDPKASGMAVSRMFATC